MSLLRNSLDARALLDVPGAEHVSLLEEIFDFFEGKTDGFGVHEEHMDEGGEVEGTEDEVGLPGDVSETRGDSPGKGEVEEPVGRL